MKRITSSDNPRFRLLRRLARSSRERKQSGLSVLDGAHLVSAYRDCVGAPDQIVVSESGLADEEIKAILAGMRQPEPVVLTDALFAQISPVVTPTGVMAVVRTPRPQQLPDEIDACIMLEGVQDPGNLGSIVRSAAAAGIRHVLLSKDSVHAWSPRAVRGGMGAHFRLDVYEQVDLRAAARAFKGTVLAAGGREPRCVYDVDLTGRVAFLFGNEGSGLSAELRAAANAGASIPMPGGGESLNLAAAVAICLFERVRQLKVKSAIRGS